LTKQTVPEEMRGRQVRTPIARRAESIRFIAEHCPLLESLQVVVSPWSRSCRKGLDSERAIRFCELEPVILALQHVSQKCIRLQTIIAVTTSSCCSTWYPEGVDIEWHGLDNIKTLDLVATPVYLREELIRDWADTVLRKVIEHAVEKPLSDELSKQ
jgi:hypothetical protein